MIIPTRKFNTCTQLCVKEYGAVGDGIHDDTLAFATAVKALPLGGGTVFIPDGIYVIDPSEKSWLRSNMRLLGSDQAFLKTKPNGLNRAYTVLVQDMSDIVLENVKVIGDRLEHTYTKYSTAALSTHEWNHGFAIRGKSSRISVLGCSAVKCAGDGISFGGDDIFILNFFAQYNRRQGMSVGGATHYQVWDSDFLDTGDYSTNPGTKPMAGIDVEPDAPNLAGSGIISGCRIQRNHAGIELYTSTTPVNGMLAAINQLVIESNDIGGNIVGIHMTRASNIRISGNFIHHSQASGLMNIGGLHGLQIDGNHFRHNYTRLTERVREDKWVTGWNSSLDRDILQQTTNGPSDNVKILSNRYTYQGTATE